MLYNCFGDRMNRYVKILVGASLIGAIIAFIFYKDIKRDVKAMANIDNTINVFQGGVFSSQENAEKLINQLKMGTIYKDENYYRVFLSITYSNDATNKIEEYLKKNSINYYLKNMSISTETLNSISQYEEILVKTTSDESLLNINNNILEIFSSYLK